MEIYTNSCVMWPEIYQIYQSKSIFTRQKGYILKTVVKTTSLIYWDILLNILKIDIWVWLLCKSYSTFFTILCATAEQRFLISFQDELFEQLLIIAQKKQVPMLWNGQKKIPLNGQVNAC